MTQSGSVSPAGGSVSATLGTQTVKVTAPPGALSGPGTLTVTVYANNAPPRTLAAAQRKVQTIGAHASLLVEFAVSLTGATLIKPLQASLTTPAAASGSIFRLAGFGSSFDDIDTVTFAGGTATSDLNITFPRMSLASATAPGTLYAFYTEPAGEAAAAAPIITPATTTALPVGMFSTAQYTASEALANGFPYIDTTFTFALDNPSLGTITPSGAFTAGGVDGTGHIVVTDTTAGRGNPTGQAVVNVSSQRPGNLGDVFNFTGTLSSTVVLLAQSSNPSPTPQTDAANVALTSTVGAFAAVTGGGQSTVASTETDTYPLLTVKTGTTSHYTYAPSGAQANVSINDSTATDSNGVKYATTYLAGNGLLDVLPEVTGAFGPNNAAQHYVETDQAGFSRDRTVAASGAYVELGKDAFGDVQTITVNADNSATYDARQYSGFRFTMSAPSGSPSTIIFRAFNSAGTQIAAFAVANWFPAGTTQPSTETDVDNGTQTYPAGCSVPAKYGTSGNRIVQTISRVDPALGNLELFTTTTYLAPRVGPVCIQMSDVIKTFYDYTLQNGFLVQVSGGTTAIETTTLTQTLTLQSASVEGGTSTLSTARGTSSVASSAFAPVSFARARFEHAVREKTNWMRRQTFERNFLSQGVKQL